MKKLLLVSIIFVFAVFLYQNVEFDLHKEMINEKYTEPAIETEQTAEIEQATSNKSTSSNNSSKSGINKYYGLVKEYISTHKPSPNIVPNYQVEDQNEQQIAQVPIEDPQITEKASNPDILSLIQKVSFEDQIRVANILLKRFSFTELNEYRTMVNNGITEEEKEEIKKTVLSRLTAEDLIGLKKIAEDYVGEYYPDQQERFNSLANRYLEQK